MVRKVVRLWMMVGRFRSRKQIVLSEKWIVLKLKSDKFGGGQSTDNLCVSFTLFIL